MLQYSRRAQFILMQFFHGFISVCTPPPTLIIRPYSTPRPSSPPLHRMNHCYELGATGHSGYTFLCLFSPIMTKFNATFGFILPNKRRLGNHASAYTEKRFCPSPNFNIPKAPFVEILIYDFMGQRAMKY